jgi:hypothetical protein
MDTLACGIGWRYSKRDNLGTTRRRYLKAVCKETGMYDEVSFARWLQRRRKALDLTQEA